MNDKQVAHIVDAIRWVGWTILLGLAAHSCVLGSAAHR